MKSRFSILVLTLLILSCNSDDDATQNEEPTLIGLWSLVNVSGGFAGVDNNFELNLITWSFDQNNWELTISNNNIVDVIFDGLPSGTYDYRILTTTGEDAYLVIDDFNFSYKITASLSSQFVLDEGIESDGFLLSFSR